MDLQFLSSPLSFAVSQFPSFICSFSVHLFDFCLSWLCIFTVVGLKTSSNILSLPATQPCCLQCNNFTTAINVTGVLHDILSYLYVLRVYGPLKLDNRCTVVLKQKIVMNSRLFGRSINIRKLSGVVRFKRFKALSQNCEMLLLAGHICLSARPHRTARLPLHKFWWN
jgi:hypothetical protein